MRIDMDNLKDALVGNDIAWVKDGRLSIIGNGEFYLITDEPLPTDVQMELACRVGKVLKRDGMAGSGYYNTKEGRKEFLLTPTPTLYAEYEPTGRVVDDTIEIKNVEGEDVFYVPKVYADIVPVVVDTYKYDKGKSMVYLNYGLCFLGIKVD